jgi:hypothetical protein
MTRFYTHSITVALCTLLMFFGCSSDDGSGGEEHGGAGGMNINGAGGSAGEAGMGGEDGTGGEIMRGAGGNAGNGFGAGGAVGGTEYGPYPTFDGLEIARGQGAVAGRIVNGDGEPIAALDVLCCSLSICLTGSTDEDGVYLITHIDADDSYKMQVSDRNNAYTTLVYHQAVASGELTVLDGDLVLPTMVSPMVEWTSEAGGTVELAGGALTLTAGADELEYPLGLEEMIQADRIAGPDFPPYSSSPWGESADSTFGFLLNPVHVHSSGVIGLEIRDEAVGEAGSVWRIFSVEPDSGVLEDAGTATVNAEGVLTSDEGGSLHHVTTIILVPEASE